MEILPHIFGLLLTVKNCTLNTIDFDIYLEQIKKKLKLSSSRFCVCL